MSDQDQEQPDAPDRWSLLTAERDLYRAALSEIVTRATVERNPDGDDQAAATMQLIAREALAASGESQPSNA